MCTLCGLVWAAVMGNSFHDRLSYMITYHVCVSACECVSAYECVSTYECVSAYVCVRACVCCRRCCCSVEILKTQTCLRFLVNIVPLLFLYL